MFCIMDVSVQWVSKEKRFDNVFLILLYLFLFVEYEKVEIRFLV